MIIVYAKPGCPHGQGKGIPISYSQDYPVTQLYIRSLSFNRTQMEGEQSDWSTYTQLLGAWNGVGAQCSNHLGTVAGAVPADEWWDFGYKGLAEANVSVSHEVVAVNGH